MDDAELDQVIDIIATDVLYRTCGSNMRDKKNRNIPSLRCFELKPIDDNKLSTDLKRLTTPELCIATKGAEFNCKRQVFKDYTVLDLYALEVGFLFSIDQIEKIVHDPLIYNEKIVGRPNNRAHSLICFKSFSDSDKPEIICKLRDHASKNIVSFDKAVVDKLVDELRSM